MRKQKRTALIALLAPPLFFMILFVIFPLVSSGYYSLLEWDGMSEGTFVGLDNFVEMLRKGKIFAAIFNTLLLLLCSLFVQFPLAIALALIIASRIRGEGTFRFIFFLPVVISTTVVCLIWERFYNFDYGAVNNALELLGLETVQRAWLADSSTAVWAVIAPAIWQWTGFYILLFYTGAKSINEELYDSAKIDGATFRQIAFKITIPLIMPVIKAAVILTTVGSFKIFDYIWIMTKGGPIGSTHVPTTLMYIRIFEEYSYGRGSAIAVFIVLECVLITAVIRKLFAVEEVTH